MKTDQTNKLKNILLAKKVMTLACCKNNKPWSSPVYFVWCNKFFAFFSNPESRHILYSKNQLVAASIFIDGDNMSEIYGLQMSGRIEKISDTRLKIQAVKLYIQKFKFLQKEFGHLLLKNPDFLQEKFKAVFYSFSPELVYFSDSVTATQKQCQVDIEVLKAAVH